jgi:CRISPR-associated protein Cmr4
MAKPRIYWLHCLSPTHVGASRGVGSIDRPIHRDKVTHWPLIPASAFRRAWADHAEPAGDGRRPDGDLRQALGLASGEGQGLTDGQDPAGGGLNPTDARLVCLPVRSFHGTFAWCTSALALRLLHRDLALAGEPDLPPEPTSPEAGTVLRPGESVLTEGGKTYLEDLDFATKVSDEADRWARWIAARVFPDDPTWQDEFRRRFAVLPDVVFDFLTETGTEVTARARIREETKTMDPAASWDEEALPAETILVGLIECGRIDAKASGDATEGDWLAEYTRAPLILQIGGQATVGRGRVRCVFTAIEGGAA